MHGKRPGDGTGETSLVERVRAATELLEAVAEDWHHLDALSAEDRRRFNRALAHLFAPDSSTRRQRSKAARRRRRADVIAREEAVLDQAGIRALRRKPTSTTPNVFPPSEPVEPVEPGEPGEPGDLSLHCYVCRRPYTALHHFYDQLCPECAEFNFRKRTELADLRGRVALLTGGRVKIGYQAGLKLLRSGAHLVVTTRFPRDAAARYAEEPDHAAWVDRLEIFGLDLRHTPSVEAFCRHLTATHDRLDFIINNACQTVRRPPDFYAHMMEAERAAAALPPEAAALVRQVPDLPGGGAFSPGFST